MKKHEKAAQIWSVLSLAARNRQVLTYDILGSLIGVPRFSVARLLEPTRNRGFRDRLAQRGHPDFNRHPSILSLRVHIWTQPPAPPPRPATDHAPMIPGGTIGG